MEQTLAEILEIVKAKMSDQGGYSREAYRGFVEETIDDFVRGGVITDDDDVEMMEDKLMLRYDEVIEGLTDSD